MRSAAVLTILLMALVTALLRVGGLWLMGRVRVSPFLERWLKNLPGSLVLAIIAPTILTGGLPEIAATVAVVLAMAWTKNLLLAMTAGVGVIFLARNFFV